jgi:hypothetical protein
MLNWAERFCKTTLAAMRQLSRGRVAAIAGGAAVLTAAMTLGAPGASAGRQAPHRAVSVPPAMSLAFRHVVSAIQTAPAASITPRGYGSYLVQQANAARHSADAGRFCATESTLASLRAALTRYPKVVKGKIHVAAAEAADLGADVLNIQALALAQPAAASCGGVKSGSPAGGPVAVVSSMRNTRVRFKILFPAPLFTVRTGAGQRYLAMSSPGMGDISPSFDAPAARGSATAIRPGGAAVGRPELPGTGELLAVPQGSQVSVRVTGSTSYRLPGVQLWPFQEPEPAGAAAASPGPLPTGQFPFTINKAAYRSAAAFPHSRVIAAPPDSMHGLRTVSVSLAGASYRPQPRVLTVLTSVTVTVTFSGTGKTNIFGPASLISPWDEGFQSAWQGSLLNYPSVPGALGPATPVIKPCGEQMIIITAPVLAGAAAQYAAERTADGILTKVFLTGPASSGGVGTTPIEIRNSIAQQYNDGCPIRPSYVLILGDTSLVPTFEISLGIHATAGGFTGNFYNEDPVATDMPYGFIHQAAQVDKSVIGPFTNYITDYDQDLFVGRIPVPGGGAEPESAALGEIGAIHGYEDSPPPPGSFYQDVTGTEFFQPCPAAGANCGRSLRPPQQQIPSTQDRQSFLRSSEIVGGMAQTAGKTFQRVASDEQDHDPAVTITPRTYDNGAAIPAGISFNGRPGNITADVNKGTFLLWHSDHGYTNGSGWYEPAFTSGNVLAASPPGAALPVVWSSDCDSGKFDDPTAAALPFTVPGSAPSFGEQWLESEHAAGFIGASRESPIFQDGFMLRGMGTSLFPELGNVLRAAFGGAAPLAPVTELGPLLDAAKLYMEQQTTADLVSDIGAQGTVLEYNDLGDPSMPIWRDLPKTFATGAFSASLTGSNAVTVTLGQHGTDGTVVLLTRGSLVLGAGVLHAGRATIAVAGGIKSLNGVSATFVRDGYLAATLAFG